MLEGLSASRWSWVAPALAALAAVLLAMALSVSAGMLHTIGLVLVVSAGVSALAATLAPATVPAGLRPASVVLALGLAASWVQDLLYLPGVLVDPTRLGAFRPLLVAVGVLLTSYAWRRIPRWASRVRYPTLVLVCAAMAATVILASPRPSIDVWIYQQHGAASLLAGRNPYELLYPNVYGPGTPLLDRSLLSADGRFVIANPYTPLVLLLDLPGFLLGDIRWTMLASMTASALLLGWIGRGRVAAELAGALLLLQPQGWMVAELAWTEPLVLAGILLVVLAVTNTLHGRGHGALPWQNWMMPGLAAGLAVSTKQYVPMLVAPFLILLPRGARLRATVVATALALAIVIPFLLLDPSSLIRGVLEFQVRQPFRADSLSIPAMVYWLGGPMLPAWPAFGLAAGVLGLTIRLGPPPGRIALGVAATWIVFVAFNKQAFANYYWLGVGLLCSAVAVFAAQDDQPSPRDTRGSS